ncbi:amidohydrolase [Ectobacillus ponti]|uniref:Amidohydrolase n=1 Tax=Ectobacillus ponti TaxID=2961894 RepID=A0AA41X5Z2_9BACI|nr:amidohydrolase [Ectobacillus ponti]MCP8967460.1 amidohydrolase [Ectobacillus ponti]
MGILYYGGRVYTMRHEGETAEAVFVQDGIIQAIGSETELRGLYEITEEVHLRGGMMLPGLVDSHMHLIGHGERLMRLDLSDCRSYEEMLGLVRERAAQLQPGEWILGDGWNENAFSDRKDIHRRDLDEITQEHPVLLKRVCRHAALVNSYVLEKAGLHTGISDPKGGKVGRGQDGLTGLLYEQAQELIAAIVPGPDDEYLQKALHTAITDCWKHGLVGCHTEDLNYYGGFDQVHRSFRHVIAEKPFKAHLLVHHEVAEERANHEDTHYIEFGAMKAFADGSIGGRTALLSEPYSDQPDTNGVAVFERDELAEIVAKARRLGMMVAIHTIGDLSFEYILDAIEQHPPQPGQRDRIIHCQILRGDLVQRAKGLPVVLDIQPVFVTSDFPSVIEKIGRERLPYAYAWKTLLEAGFLCAGGSDAPVERVNPFLGIYGAVARKSFFDGECYGPEQRLTMFEAVRLFTYGSACAISREHKRGMIAPGYEADFTVVDRDIFAIEPEAVQDTQVLMTVIDGTAVYTL